MLKYQTEYLLDSNILLSINRLGDSLDTLRDWIKAATFILTRLFIKMEISIYINIFGPKKRFNKWIKAEKVDDLETVKEYYGYSTEKAKQILPLLNESIIDEMRKRITKGGKK